MGLLHKVGLMTVSEHNAAVTRNVEEMNKYVAIELEKRALQVDETLGEIAKWRFDPAGLVQDKAGMTLILEVPRSLVVGMTRSQPDISGFAIARMIHLLQATIQKAVNQVFSGGYGDGEARQGSYL
jgi:hypothetical protein